MLDLTNGDILDATPITSGFVRETPISPRTVLSKPIIKGVGGSIPRTIPTPIQVTPTISTPTTPKAVEATTSKDEPKSAPKSSGGGSGSGSGSGSPKSDKKEEKKEEKKEDKKDAKTKDAETKIVEQKESFWSLKNPFHYAVIAGALIGFFYARKNAKNILASTLIGAGIGGGLGYGIKSFMKKDTNDDSSKKEGVINNDDDLIKILIENMKQLVVSMATIMGQDKAKVEQEFNQQFDAKKDEIIKKSKEILSTLKDNEKKALGEMLSYENSLYKTNLSNEKDAEKLNSDLDNKIQELSKKYSVDLKSVIEKLKQQK